MFPNQKKTEAAFLFSYPHGICAHMYVCEFVDFFAINCDWLQWTKWIWHKTLLYLKYIADQTVFFSSFYFFYFIFIFSLLRHMRAVFLLFGLLLLLRFSWLIECSPEHWKVYYELFTMLARVFLYFLTFVAFAFDFVFYFFPRY